MSIQVNIHEAKTHLSRLVQRVVNGEDIVIARSGKPLVRMVPVSGVIKSKRMPGTAIGQVEIAPNFDGPLPSDLQEHFE